MANATPENARAAARELNEATKDARAAARELRAEREAIYQLLSEVREAAGTRVDEHVARAIAERLPHLERDIDSYFERKAQEAERIVRECLTEISNAQRGRPVRPPSVAEMALVAGVMERYAEIARDQHEATAAHSLADFYKERSQPAKRGKRRSN
jgi:hypothetical protein